MCIHKHARNYTLPKTRMHTTRCNNRNRHPFKIGNGTYPIYLSIQKEKPPKQKDSLEVIIEIDPSEVITRDHVSLFGMSHASTY